MKERKRQDRFNVWIKESHPIAFSLSLLFITLCLILFVVLLCFGYRFAIYENIRPDWEAFSTILTFFAALGAIGAAIFIPKRIAQQQNDIALFKEKYEVYQKCAIFLSRWRFSCEGILAGSSREEKYIGCVTSILLKLKKSDRAEEIIIKSLDKNSIECDLEMDMFDFYEEDLFLFKKASCIFRCIGENQIIGISDSYNEFVDRLRVAIVNREFDEKLDSATKQFLNEIKSIVEFDILVKMAEEISRLKM